MEINPPNPGAFMPSTSDQNLLGSKQAVKTGIFFLNQPPTSLPGGPLIDPVREQACMEVHMLT